MKIGVSLLGLRGSQLLDVAVAAEELGYESVWHSDHLILPSHTVAGVSHGPVPATLPLWDTAGVLGYIAGRTSTIRLGTWVYVLPVRAPLVSARTFQTIDVLSGGRAEIGVGVGYIEEEFAAAGVDFKRRGALMDEAILACKALWRDDAPSHSGEFYSFGRPVSFEPKPLQRPWPRLHIGGGSRPALRRAVREGDGWIGGEFTPTSLVPVLSQLDELSRSRTAPLEITVGAGNVTMATSHEELPPADPVMIEQFARLGVDRVIVRPWVRSRNAVEGLSQFADECMS